MEKGTSIITIKNIILMTYMSNTHPLQTPEWAEFREKWGNEILKTKYGYLTLHKIPLISKKIGIFEKGPMPTKEMLEELKKIGQENNLVFIKLEPNVQKTEKLIALLRENATP